MTFGIDRLSHAITNRHEDLRHLIRETYRGNKRVIFLSLLLGST